MDRRRILCIGDDVTLSFWGLLSDRLLRNWLLFYDWLASRQPSSSKSGDPLMVTRFAPGSSSASTGGWKFTWRCWCSALRARNLLKHTMSSNSEYKIWARNRHPSTLDYKGRTSLETDLTAPSRLSETTRSSGFGADTNHRPERCWTFRVVDACPSSNPCKKARYSTGRAC